MDICTGTGKVVELGTPKVINKRLKINHLSFLVPKKHPWICHQRLQKSD
jgi:hypothetical protein